MVDPVIAILVGIIAVLAGAMVFARNPISSAFSLVALMVALGGVYAVIGAHFMAALQIIVYAGAIMVLFVFSIMLLNMNEDLGDIDYRSWKTTLAVFASMALTLIFTVSFVAWMQETRLPPAGLFSLEKIEEIGGNVVAVSGLLFSEAFIQFEIISLVLLVAIAGALVLAKRKVD